MDSLPAFADLNKSFLNYYNSFDTDDSEILGHFKIKKDHTYRVISFIRSIAAASGLSSPETELARIIALFHDIGRFEQFVRYRTFNDSISENHAAMAIRVLHQQQFLSLVDDRTKNIIIASIENHNIPVLPDNLDPSVSLFSRLLRDADKLDIWRLSVEQINVAFTIRNEKEADHYHISQNILSCIREGRVVLLDYADSMNDFRLLRLSWLVDMNFPATFLIIQEKQYIDKILALIPDFPEKKEISSIFHAYCKSRI
jgi:hypothetical protein